MAAVDTAAGRALSDAALEQTEAFLDADQHATGRACAKNDLQACRAAGLGSAPTTLCAATKTAIPGVTDQPADGGEQRLLNARA